MSSAACCPSLRHGWLAGLAGGVLGAFTMNLFVRAAGAGDGREADGASPGADRQGRGVQPPQAEGRAEEDAAVQAGTAMARTITGQEPSARERRRLGVLTHYGFGASAGLVYGLLAERVPALRSGFGSVYGALVWAIADEGVTPALGLSRSPRELPATVHAHALLGHIVYGMTLEAVTRGLEGSSRIHR